MLPEKILSEMYFRSVSEEIHWEKQPPALFVTLRPNDLTSSPSASHALNLIYVKTLNTSFYWGN